MPRGMPRGTTQTAQYLDRASQTIAQHFHHSIAFGKQTVYSELAMVWNECCVPGWDGYEAIAVAPRTLRNALAVIQALPVDYPMPSVGAEADGALTLEWYRHPRWLLSVSISPEGMLYYAALFGNRDVRGAEPFLGTVPQSILDLIQRVYLYLASEHACP